MSEEQKPWASVFDDWLESYSSWNPHNLKELCALVASRAENAMLEKCIELARKYMGHIPDGEVTSVDDFFTKLQSLRKEV